jgi:hypothetical protein
LGGGVRLAGGAGSLLGSRSSLGRGSSVLLSRVGLLLRLARHSHRPGRPLLELLGAVGELLLAVASRYHAASRSRLRTVLG